MIWINAELEGAKCVSSANFEYLVPINGLKLKRIMGMRIEKEKKMRMEAGGVAYRL